METRQDGRAVTSQPPAGASGNTRRPIPASAMDWFSSPGPMHLHLHTGPQYLADVEQLEIQQVIDLSTLLGRTDKGSQYRVKVPRAETLFLAMESMSETRSWMFGWYKSFVLNVLDQRGGTAFVIRKEPGWMHVPGSRQSEKSENHANDGLGGSSVKAASELPKQQSAESDEFPAQRITVESGNPIGSVQENFSVIGPSFTVYDANGKPLCDIRGPNICGCCMYKEAQFQVTSIDGTHQIASLMHHWDHLSVDYTLLLTFPLETDAKLKSLLLGASFLIEYLYFQRVRRASRN